MVGITYLLYGDRNLSTVGQGHRLHESSETILFSGIVDIIWMLNIRSRNKFGSFSRSEMN